MIETFRDFEIYYLNIKYALYHQAKWIEIDSEEVENKWEKNLREKTYAGHVTGSRERNSSPNVLAIKFYFSHHRCSTFG